MKLFDVRPINKNDRTWIISLLKEWWAGPKIVTRGKVHRADELPGFIAEKDNKPAGLITYNMAGKDCEIVTMNSLIEKTGIGSALLEAVKNAAISEGCRRLWLITTNDNIKALKFYQKRGFHMAAVYPDAMEESRRLIPEIPLTGHEDIPVRDEVELEMML